MVGQRVEGGRGRFLPEQDGVVVHELHQVLVLFQGLGKGGVGVHQHVLFDLEPGPVQ